MLQDCEFPLSSIIHLQQIYWECGRRGGALPPIQRFSLLGEWGESAPPSEKFLILPPRKIPSTKICSIFVLISYFFDTQVMLILILIDVQYSQKAVFNFERGSNCQNLSSSGSLYQVKKFAPVKYQIPTLLPPLTKYLPRTLMQGCTSLVSQYHNTCV